MSQVKVGLRYVFNGSVSRDCRSSNRRWAACLGTNQSRRPRNFTKSLEQTHRKTEPLIHMLHLHITIAPILALKYLGTALESSAYILPSNLATIRPTRKIRLPRPRLTDKKKHVTSPIALTGCSSFENRSSKGRWAARLGGYLGQHTAGTRG